MFSFLLTPLKSVDLTASSSFIHLSCGNDSHCRLKLFPKIFKLTVNYAIKDGCGKRVLYIVSERRNFRIPYGAHDPCSWQLNALPSVTG
ncbi:hypothetical protein CDAR_406451 [Caerostris darwini]|uniref:Uncharacterized protein n=1 Tax=Caerostris darwini TaxID=1538125 RepID=A0AAV4MM98_9ARAC|nr:hypothetical protein CDAR_406451 [Caerostris darwini]